VTAAGLRAVSSDLPALTSLSLSWCEKAITDEALRAVSRLPELASLKLGYCEAMTDKGVRAVSGMPALTHLDLTWCERVTDEGLRALSGAPLLRTLRLEHEPDNLTPAGLQALRDAAPSLYIQLGGR